MRRLMLTVIGVCILIIGTALPVAAQTDSSVHKSYEWAEGVATGFDDGVWTTVVVKRAASHQSFRAPDDTGDIYRNVVVQVSVYYHDTASDERCSTSKLVSDPAFNWSAGHATLNVDTACGPMTAVWRGEGAPTVEPYNRYHTDYLGNVTHAVGTEWERQAVMTATINGSAADHFSWDALLSKHTSMYTVDNAG